MSFPSIKITFHDAPKAEAPAADSGTEGGKARMPSSTSPGKVAEPPSLDSAQREGTENWIDDSVSADEEAERGDSTGESHSWESETTRYRRGLHGAGYQQPQSGHLRVPALAQPQQGVRAGVLQNRPDPSPQDKREASTKYEFDQGGEE